MEMFDSQLEVDGDAAWIHLTGSIDFYNTSSFEQVLNDNFESGRLKLGLDFSELTSIDSSGLTVLIEALHKYEAADGEIIITGLKNNVRQLFTLTRLEDLFNVFYEKTAARAYFKTGKKE